MLSHMRTVLAALALAAITAAAFADDRTYDLRGPKPKQGDAVREDASMEMRDGVMTMKMGEMEMTGRMRIRSRSVDETTILEVNDDGPSKVKIHYRQVVEEQQVEMMGQRQNERQEGPLHGRTVIGSLKEGKWTFVLEEGDPDFQQQRKLSQLEKEYNDGLTNPYPERAVRVGETWELTGRELKQFLNDRDAEGKATFTLVEVNEVDGAPVAKMNVKIEAKSKVEQDEDAEVTLTLEGTIERSLATHLDVNSELRGTMTVESEKSEMAMKMTMKGPVTLRAKESRPSDAPGETQ